MTEQAFRDRGKERWDELSCLQSRKLSDLNRVEVHRFAALYRETVRDLSFSRSLGNATKTEVELRGLVQQARRRLFHRGHWGVMATLWRFYTQTLPRTTRQYGMYFLGAAALLLLPMALTYSLAKQDPGRAYAMATTEQRDTARAHQLGLDENRDPRLSGAASAFYITHNGNLCLRAFAGGVTLGLGTVWSLVYNGYALGVTFALVEALGAEDTLGEFVAAHLPWELLAVVMAGAGGLMMGVGLLRPRNLTRSESLARIATDAITLASGSMTLLVIAGIIEGTVSPSPLGPETKLLMGALGTGILVIYVFLGGRKTSERTLTPPQYN